MNIKRVKMALTKHEGDTLNKICVSLGQIEVKVGNIEDHLKLLNGSVARNTAFISRCKGVLIFLGVTIPILIAIYKITGG